MQHVMGLLNVIVSIAGVAICATKLSRSGSALPILIGFALEALTSLVYMAGTIVIQSGTLSYQQIGLAYGAASLVGLVGRAAIVVGLAGLFADLARQAAPAADAGLEG
jgi:hypothetical protein